MNNNRPGEREIVFCHQCENEWYRDEHGIICPECQGEFTEIIEAGHDPRDDDDRIPADPRSPHDGGDFYAPDPDEDDIDDVRLERTGPETYRLRGTYRTTLGGEDERAQQQQGQQGLGGGLMGMVGNILQGMVGPQQQQGQQQQGQQTPQGPNSPGRPSSAPGSPPPQRSPNGTFVRHHHGPGYSFTIATSSNSNFGGGQMGGGMGMGPPPGLFPRNAHAPQPFQNQPDHMEQMLNQMMLNIGVMPGQQMGGMRGAPGQGGMPHPFHNDGNPFGAHAHGPFIIGGGGGGGQGMPGPFAQLLNMFGPPGGVAGDAVYSQEALDRIITQLMEQHQAGNAPGPASEAAIKSLPKKTITAKDQGESGKAECSICMDEVPIGDEVTELPCHHWFHFDCVKAWLEEHDTCPHCRQGIMPRDGQNEGNGQPREHNQAPLHDMRSPEYARPAGIPGAFPFPRQESSGPEGSGGDRTRNSEGDRRGMFGRMRDAFSGGSGTGGSRNGGAGRYGDGSGGASGS